MILGIGTKLGAKGKLSPKLRVASAVHYEQAFFIRQIIAASVPVVSLIVRHSLPHLMSAFYVVIVVTCLNLFYYWLTVSRRFRPSFKWVQIGIDMFLWTLLIHLTGGRDSVFFFLYPLEILVAAFTLSASGCIYSAALASIFYTIEVGFFGPRGALDNTHATRILFLSAVAALSVLVVKKLEKKTIEVEKLTEMLRERAESAETSLGAVLDTMGSGLVIVNENGIVLTVNEPFVRMCGIPDGKLPREITSGTPLDRIRGLLLELLNSGDGEKNVELPLTHESGSNGNLLLNTKVFRRRGERCIMAIVSENAFEAVDNIGVPVSGNPDPGDSLPEVGETAAMVAHEVRNSMTCIMGLLSLLNEDLAEKTESAGVLKKAVSAAEDLNKFVSDLLLYSRGVEPRYERVDLVRMVEAVSESVSTRLCSGKKVRLTKEFSSDRIEAEVDPRYIQRVLMNLLLNSYQAVGDEPSVHVLLRQVDGEALIEVKDNGCGIPAESIDRIFEPFFSTKGTGGGLGLAIVKKLVEAHLGQVTVRSSPGSGTALTVRVPLTHENTKVGKTKDVLLGLGS